MLVKEILSWGSGEVWKCAHEDGECGTGPPGASQFYRMRSFVECFWGSGMTGSGDSKLLWKIAKLPEE